jgi:hypothetical protein
MRRTNRYHPGHQHQHHHNYPQWPKKKSHYRWRILDRNQKDRWRRKINHRSYNNKGRQWLWWWARKILK